MFSKQTGDDQVTTLRYRNCTLIKIKQCCIGSVLKKKKKWYRCNPSAVVTFVEVILFNIMSIIGEGHFHDFAWGPTNPQVGSDQILQTDTAAPLGNIYEH